VKAIVVSEFGGAEQLRPAEAADPVPGPGQVRVAVRAAGVNPVDAGNRADGSWAGLRVPFVPGYDIAGVVDSLGSGVSGLALGDRVMAMTHFPDGAGGYAELAVVGADQVAPIGAGTSFADAAATPLAGGTAYSVLSRLALSPGSKLLVLGASGGVGLFLLQLAAAQRIQAIAVGSAARRPDRRDRHPRTRPRPAARRQHHLPRRAHRRRRPADPAAGLAPGPGHPVAGNQPPAATVPGCAGPPYCGG